MSKEISKAVIKRLPRYYRYLGELKEEGVKRISSGALSSRMKVTASQIRQDLNHFGGFGQQGYGYNVDFLHEEIGKILGLDKTHPMILVGAGNLGLALANYHGFERRGFKLVGVFDANPLLEGKKVGEIHVSLADHIEAFLKENPVEIAILAIPGEAAKGVALRLSKCGIRAIWNFAHVDLDLPESVVVENVHLSESLMTLSYNLGEYKKDHPDKS
ncbi:MAG: redox-sensing transcriptional repressor Rex [Blautia sp.]|nr:redox-sensing transcriptional repressor Rex [Blautia sp.]